MSSSTASGSGIRQTVRVDKGRASLPWFSLKGQNLSSRIFDIATALVLLTVLAPVVLMAALAIKLDDPTAGVLFWQIRYGYRGVPFLIVKLRTMVPDAESQKAKFATLSIDQGPGFKIRNDPRVTRVGRILRKLYIDELPQLWNVLKGEMSIVGPRANSFNPTTYEPWQRIRLAVKPGMTGTWQVSRERPASFDERCQMDIEYLTTKSLWADIRMVFATVAMVLTRPSGT